MVHTFRSSIAALIALAIASACSSDGFSTQIELGDAQIRVVNAASAWGSIDVTMGPSSVVTALPYGRSSPLIRVPSGPQTLRVRAQDGRTKLLSATLAANDSTAVVVVEDSAYATPIPQDTGIVASNRANIRLINVPGAADAGTGLVEMRVEAPNLPAPKVAVTIQSSAASYGPLMYFDPGHFRVEFVRAGTSSVIAQAEFDVSAGEKKALVLERTAAGYAVRVITEP